MNVRSRLLAAAFAALVTAAPAFAGEVTVWGSTTCQKKFLEPGAAALEKATGVKVKVLGVGTGKGMLALAEGKAPVAAASEDLDGAVKSAQKAAQEAGQKFSPPGNLQFHRIADDTIVPIVNKDNPVQNLTWEQLAKLNTGEIKNWKEVGGPDLPVVVVTSHAGSATKAVFQKEVMAKKDYAPGAIEVNSTRLEINEVSKNKGAIGAVSEAFFNLNPGSAKVVKSKPITRPLALITAGKPSADVQKIIDFFRSPEGKKTFAD